MRPHRFTTIDRATAVLALAALVFVLIVSSGAVAGEPEAGGERCVGCSSCEGGDCDEGCEQPLTSHHHCCATSCMTHLSIAIPTASAAPTPLAVGPMGAGVTVAAVSRTTETPYRPPRV